MMRSQARGRRGLLESRQDPPPAPSRRAWPSRHLAVRPPASRAVGERHFFCFKLMTCADLSQQPHPQMAHRLLQTPGSWSGTRRKPPHPSDHPVCSLPTLPWPPGCGPRSPPREAGEQSHGWFPCKTWGRGRWPCVYGHVFVKICKRYCSAVSWLWDLPRAPLPLGEKAGEGLLHWDSARGGWGGDALASAWYPYPWGSKPLP